MKNIVKEELREHSYPDETKNIGVDFDGVIHRCSKGFYDGTIYDPPIEGSKEALDKLSKKYDVIVFSAKARDDRPIVDGKTGRELIEEWLEKYDMMQYVKEVSAEKPRAVCYIDDKAIRFDTWEQSLSDVDRIYGL